MKKEYKVANWKQKGKLYNFNIVGDFSDNYRVRGESEEIDGFFLDIKGQPLICYSDGALNMLFYRNAIISSDDVSDFRVKTVWPFVYTTIKAKETIIKFREFVPLLLFQKKIDPTFDWLDLSSDLFSAHIAEKLDRLS